MRSEIYMQTLDIINIIFIIIIIIAETYASHITTESYVCTLRETFDQCFNVNVCMFIYGTIF